MKASIYSLAVETYVPRLKTLSILLDKAEAQAGEKAESLIDARLAPDMFTLAQQVQQACHYAADGMSRLASRGPRPFPPVGSSFGEMKSGIEDAISFVTSIPEAELAGVDERDCSFEIPNSNMEIGMDGSKFLRSWALPHFYFHIVTAYNILRSNGIEIGKRDYINLADAVRPRAT